MLPSRCSQPACRNMLVNTSRTGSESQSPFAMAAESFGRHDAVLLDEPAERLLAALRQETELPREHDAARGNQGQRDHRRPAGRVGVAQRDHRLTGGSRRPAALTAWGSSPASWSVWGPGWRPGRSLGRRRRLGLGRLEAACGARCRDPPGVRGSRPRRGGRPCRGGRPRRRPRRRGGTARGSRRCLVEGDDPVVDGVVGVQRGRPLAGRAVGLVGRREQHVARFRAQQCRPRAVGAQPAAGMSRATSPFSAT